MRLLGALVLSTLLPLSAFADAGATAVDDEPTKRDVDGQPPTSARPADRHAPAETGELRSARIAAPDPVAVHDAAGVAREHDVAPPHAVAAAATDGDVVAELAAHQMKRHQRALDACLAAAHKRAPAAAGTLTLDFDVADRKVKSVRVADDGVHDAALAACLASTARSFTFALAAARFRWPVALHP
ncbi:MAG TPA: hypothetical protein VF997_12855 [Polyangia bacterium]